MKRFPRKLIQTIVCFGAVIVIVLAIGIGMFRLMLLRAPVYQEEIKAWASNSIGMDVEFAGMNARWRLSGPELSFYDTELNHHVTGASALNAEEVSIGVGLWRLIADRELVVDRVTIRDTSIDLQRNGDGTWLLQGIAFSELVGEREMSADAGDIVFIGEDIAVDFEDLSSGRLVPFDLQSVVISRNSSELRVDSEINLQASFGERLEIAASRRLGPAADDIWHLYVEADSINLAEWSRFKPESLPEIQSGTADFVLWFDLDVGQVDNASANVVLSDLQAVGQQEGMPLGLQGSFEYSLGPEEWLFGANQMRLVTVEGTWPQSSVQLRLEQGDDGTISDLRANASYFSLDDLEYLDAWLSEDWRQLLDNYQPSGVVQDVQLELRGLGTPEPEFDMSANLDQVGFAVLGEWPGVRDFSGRVRADRDGGRIEIESNNLTFDFGEHLPAPLILDDAFGTLIWRRNRDGIIVLSDSVQIRNADLDSQMSLQVSIPVDGSSPIVDFDSTWSVFDVSALPRYLPVKFVTPKLHAWLTDALVSGYVRRGTTRLSGSLDDFPFDDDEGIFRIDARLEDTVLQYRPDWPAPVFRHLDVVVENKRVYSEENSADNYGISIEDARMEIADFQEPVLTIDTFATGTMQSIKTFVIDSPIATVFRGQLDRVSVDGEASFDLSIVLPINNVADYDFTTRIRASDAMMALDGFPSPLRELNGTVTISRDHLSSESLFATFLGNPVDLTLNRLPDPTLSHRNVLSATGSTTTEALQAELGVQLNGIVSGTTNYKATLHFPNDRSPEPGMFQIVVESDLLGLQSSLPAPLDKQADEVVRMTASIDYPTPDRIVTAGSLAGEVNWIGNLARENGKWDFDRGVVSVGEYPRAANVRGLHIHGQLAEVDLHEWLAVIRRGNQTVGVSDRIRTIDLDVGDLQVVGQTFTDHRIEVNRSGRDWVILLTGDEVSGTVTVPYDFSAGRPMVLDMERLALSGGNGPIDDDRPAPIDPRSLPALSVHAVDFTLGGRRFGALDVDFDRTPRGLESINLRTSNDTFSVSGSAGWIVDTYAESDQRTYITSVLQSNNTEKTFSQLDYDPGIIGDAMEISMDLQWPGSPLRDFMAVLNGDVNVSLAEGRLSEVNPGAGRVFGLMSFTALPRRLSLDFSDVFISGFGYDQIVGDFRLVNGNAYTCNLTLIGPAADVGIVGRAGLLSRDYDQVAIVSTNVGNTLPVAGFFLGGPQIAAALLVFAQVFRKPLKDMGQVFYSVEGSWDDPGIDLADSTRFADTSSRAGCLSSE